MFTINAGNKEVGLFSGQGTSNENSFVGMSENTSLFTDNNFSFGLFKASSSTDINRPEVSGGVGQTAPIGDGLFVLIAYSAVWILVKVIQQKNKRH